MNTAKQVMDEVVYTSMIESSNEFQTFNELPLVSEMDPKAAMMIFSCMTKKTFADDEVIYEAGTYSVSQMYLVLDGKINVKNESGYKYNSLRKGDVFGLFSFLDEDRKHSVTAKVETAATVLTLDRAYFDLICIEEPVLGNQLMRFMFRLLSEKALKFEVEYAHMHNFAFGGKV
ncbi:MAG: hypothetical protein AUK35_02835 [Zetaproteobacteria bacterium CG2_30_46_52]|nr:MAG: hypothetical protein AUK35_02835 [Zetaproteobacteria bacterium CG2_30_46_52]